MPGFEIFGDAVEAFGGHAVMTKDIKRIEAKLR